MMELLSVYYIIYMYIDECASPCHSVASRLADKHDLQGARLPHSPQKAAFKGTVLRGTTILKGLRETLKTDV